MTMLVREFGLSLCYYYALKCVLCVWALSATAVVGRFYSLHSVEALLLLCSLLALFSSRLSPSFSKKSHVAPKHNGDTSYTTIASP